MVPLIGSTVVPFILVGQIKMKNVFIFLLLLPMVAGAAECPAGFTTVEYDGFVVAESGGCPAGYVAHDIETVCGAGDGVCWLIEQLRALCGAGVSHLKTSMGVSVSLYAVRETTPSLCVQYNDTVCYADMKQGQQTGAININYGGTIYHVE